MSGSFTLWSWKPQSKRLMESVKKAKFHHFMGGRDYGLTYQSCRFCGLACFRADDNSHGYNCWRKERTGEDCRGLWKYSVRHYICGACRKSVNLGLEPKKRDRS